MGIFDNLGKIFGAEKEEQPDIEKYLQEIEIEEEQKKNPPADFYIKSITIEDEQTLQTVFSELEQRNIVIVKLSPSVKQQPKFKKVVDALKENANKIQGDIAALDENRLIVTPARVRIVKAMKR
ncbi:MAG: cell division protein SepF [Candidatus Anstonellales archaeon]